MGWWHNVEVGRWIKEWEWLWSSEVREWRGKVVSVVGSEGERRGWSWSLGMVSESMTEHRSHGSLCCGVVVTNLLGSAR
jgi:hypothetical protein